MTNSSHELDMCNGPLTKKILFFSIPLMFSSILQLFFNAIDIIVVGNFTGSDAVAAVGSTAPLINLLVNAFIGLSIGSNVVIARAYGAGDNKMIEDALHTSILLSLLSGIALGVVGVIWARPILILMGMPENVLDLAVIYIKIYFLSMPAMLLYNFGSSILRAIGDTTRPLVFLSIAGSINACLNLIFVIIFKMGVAGVAIATTISEYVSAILILFCLTHNQGACKLYLSKLCFHQNAFFKIIRVGLPAGLQGCIFSASNVLIQSSVNSFGSVAMAGNAAAVNLEGFIYNSMNAYHQAALSFTAQNLGAKKYDRIKKVLLNCLLLVSLTGCGMSFIFLLFRRQLLGFYCPNSTVIDYGVLRMYFIIGFYFLCGIMDVFVGSLRGMGYSIIPMIVSLLGACAFRVVWIFTIFQTHHSLPMLYISYPVSWTITAFTHLICFILFYKRLFKAN